MIAAVVVADVKFQINVNRIISTDLNQPDQNKNDVQFFLKVNRSYVLIKMPQNTNSLKIIYYFCKLIKRQ